MNRKRFSGQRGASIVEAPIVLIVIAFFALGVLGFVQIFIQYQHLTSATRAAANSAGFMSNSFDLCWYWKRSGDQRNVGGARLKWERKKRWG